MSNPNIPDISQLKNNLIKGFDAAKRTVAKQADNAKKILQNVPIFGKKQPQESETEETKESETEYVPEELSEKYQIQISKESLMPDGTLFLDFGPNKEIDDEYNHDKLYKVGLKDQFMKLPISGEYETFVTDILPCRATTVGISYPNFERNEPSLDEKNRWFNIAVRIPLGEDCVNDMVLMCDLSEYTPKNKPMLRSLKVKGFTMIDKSTETCGELVRNCKITTRLNSNGEWHSEDGEPIKHLSEQQINDSILTLNFLRELNEQYVAEPHGEILDRLDQWQRYLNFKTEVMEKDQDIGYSAGEGTEVILAYYKDNCTEEELRFSIPHLRIKGKNGVWSNTELTDSQEAPILHFTYDIKKEDEDTNSENLRKFERFTSFRSLIFSQKIKYKRSNGSESRFPQYPDETRLQESRISSRVNAEEIQNKAKIKSILNEVERQLADFKNQCRRQYSEDLTERVNSFEKTELVNLISAYRDEIIPKYLSECEQKRITLIGEKRTELNEKIREAKEELSKYTEKQKSASENVSKIQSELSRHGAKSKNNAGKRIAEKNEKNLKEAKNLYSSLSEKITETNNRIESLNREYSNIENSISAEKLLEEMMSPEIERYKNRTVAEYREKVEPGLHNTYYKMYEEKKKDAEEKGDAEIKEVIKNETILRFHVFFRLDVDSSADTNSIIENVRKKAHGHQMFLYRDYSGDRAVIGRHSQALNYLRKGFVMNPFLATALFNSSKQSVTSEHTVKRFYSPRLNDRQKHAVTKALSSNGLFLIRGPPGTGKTEVIAEITAQLVVQGKKVLIASENHKAVDNAFDRLPGIPTLRAVRVFGSYASKREEKNKFAASKLTRNFYSDIAKCLDDEIRKSSTASEYAGKLDEIIKNIRKRSEELTELKKSADQILSEIKTKEREINNLDRKIASDKNENRKYDEKIRNLNTEIESVRNCEHDVFKDIASQINVQIGGNRLNVRQIKALYAMNKTDINKEFLTIRKHRIMFDLFAQKSSETDENRKNHIEAEIQKYQNEHDINACESHLLEIFPEGIPDKETVDGLKEMITDAVDAFIITLEEKIDECTEICNDTTSAEKKMNILEHKLQDLRSDERVSQYENAKQNLETEIRRIFADNNITETYETAEEAIECIESEKERIKSTASSGLSAELQKSYRKMAGYLKDESVIEKDQEDLNKILLEYANVIGLTCTTKDSVSTDAGDIDLKRVNLDVVIVDEVSKASFLEILYPILYGKTVILVGDDKQLPPIYQSNVDRDDMSRYDSTKVNEELEKQFRFMYETSFFRELYNTVPDCNKTMLTVQYRMHPDIMDADNIFYDGQLTYGGAKDGKEHYLEIRGPQKRLITPRNHLIFIDTEGEETRGYSGGTSYTNSKEIDVIVNLLKKMENGCKKDSNGENIGGRTFSEEYDPRLSLGVICGYSDQAKLIRRKLKGFKFQAFNRKEEEQFMVDTVDNFQGDERDIIILSLVRSNPERSFMTKFNRINVAISRARCLLIIVGNEKAFSSLRIELDGKNEYVYSKIVDAARKNHGLYTANDVLGE